MVARSILALSIAIGCFCLSGCHQKSTGSVKSTQSEGISESKVATSESQQSEPPTATSRNPVICYLKMRDKLITIHAGSAEPLYTVKSEDGKILAVELDAAELSAKFPELKDMLEQGFANWAGNDTRQLAPSSGRRKTGFADLPANDTPQLPPLTADFRLD